MSENKETNSFIMYKQWCDQVEMLSKEQQSELLVDIFRYQCYKEEPQTDDKLLLMFWVQIKKRFDYDEKMYLERCRKNAENIRKRWNKEKESS